ncbi:MAG TPA: winged helix-turn-helix domain-containing protein [Terriglobia bacterium]|nr:winged helix-turn-helix domain-containing protein [Terriglobia bacterium]
MPINTLYEFNGFRMDPRDGALYRDLQRVPLTQKQFETLLALVENHGRVVSKRDLMQLVWPDTFVEEGNLTVNISLLRKELGETEGGIKFIETIPKRGYRFVAPVREFPVTCGSVSQDFTHRDGKPAQLPEAQSAPGFELKISNTAPAVHEAAPRPGRVEDQTAIRAKQPGFILPTGDRPKELSLPRASLGTLYGLIFAGLFAVVLGGLAWLIVNRPYPSPKVLQVTQITHFGLAESVATDGFRVYITQSQGSHFSLVQVPNEGGDPAPIRTPFRNVVLLDISPDRSELLVASFDYANDPQQLWRLPLAGGSPRQLGEGVSNSARWSPDGKQIVFQGEDGALHLINSDGTDARKLAGDSGGVESWSPDGRQIQFIRGNNSTGGMSLWQVNTDGTHLQPILPERESVMARWGEGQCCSSWTPDGKYFLFREAFFPKVGLWAVQEKKGLLQFRLPKPVEIFAAVFDFGTPAITPDGRRAFLVGRNEKRELVRYDRRLQQFIPLLPGLSAGGVNWSPDGRWVTYVTHPDACLWKQRLDGSDRIQLTFPPMQVFGSIWSPDGTRLVFHALRPSKPGKLCLIPAGGGQPEVLFSNDSTSEDVPNWSRDGQTLMFARTWLDKDGNATESAICMFDFKNNQVVKLRGSEDMGPPAWSPDGRYVAAQSDDFKSLMLFDFNTQKWRVIAHAGLVNAPQWTHDSKSIIYQDSAAGEDQPIYRVSVAGGRIEEIASRKQLLRGDVSRYALVGLDPNDDPVAVVIQKNADVYALDLSFPK